MDPFDRWRKQWAFVVGLSLFFVATTLLWLYLDRLPPTWDDAWYLNNSLVMFDSLVDAGLLGYAKRFLTILGFKPPLIVVLPTPAYALFGRQPSAAYAVNLFSMVVLFAAIHRIAEKYAGPTAGSISVYVAGTMPMLYGLSRWFLVEYTMAALVTVAIWCLIESKIFWFGLICGLGLLLKANFPLYVAAPFLYWAITTWPLVGRWRTWLVLVPAVLLPLPWYALNYKRTLQTALEAGAPSMAYYGDVSVGSYFLRLVKEGPSFYYAVLMAVVVVVALARKPALTSRGILISAVWGLPFLFFVFGPFREPRYAAPLLPAFALAVGLLLDSVRAVIPRWSSAVICTVLAFPMVAMLQNSFGLFGNWRLGSMRYTARYNRRSWPLGEVLAHLDGTGRLLVGSDTPHFNASNLELAATERRLPLDVSTTAYEQDLNVLYNQLNATSFFAYKEGGEQGSSLFNPHGTELMHEVRNGGEFIELPYRPLLPDGGVVHLFKNLTRNVFLPNGVSIPSGLNDLTTCKVVFGDVLELTGILVNQAGGAVGVKYRWRCVRPPEREYWCFTHILDEQGHVIGYLDHKILNGNPPMVGWSEDDQAIERLRFRSTAIQPGKKYRLRLGLYHQPSGQRLPVGLTNFPVADQGTAVYVVVPDLSLN
jgi:hypothetical protein